MRRERLYRLIQAYGSDSARWPAPDRAAARANPADSTAPSPDLSRLLAGAAAVDAALSAWRDLPPQRSAKSAAELARAAIARADAERRRWTAWSRRVAGVAIVVGGLLGSAVGLREQGDAAGPSWSFAFWEPAP
ncbi:MAG: hypothetical protein ACK5XB_15080 [Rhodospirillales bacterium]